MRTCDVRLAADIWKAFLAAASPSHQAKSSSHTPASQWTLANMALALGVQMTLQCQATTDTITCNTPLGRCVKGTLGYVSVTNYKIADQRTD